MNKKKIVIVVGFIIVIGLVLVLLPRKRETLPVETIGLQRFTLGSETYVLKKQDNLSVNAWDELEVIYNGKSYKNTPVIYQDVTIGTDYKAVLERFDIREDYAWIDMEVSNALEDGTTDIVQKIYKNEDVFKEEYLDLSITFAYAKENNEWIMIPYKEVETYRNEKKELLIYYIDFNGLADEMVDMGEVISFQISYQ